MIVDRLGQIDKMEESELLASACRRTLPFLSRTALPASESVTPAAYAEGNAVLRSETHLEPGLHAAALDHDRPSLFLQGPMGPFFSRFGRYIQAQGGKVWKINFNGGDWLDSRGLDSISFRGTLEEWPLFLARVIRQYRIGQIFMYGDCRPYHRLAIAAARQAGIRTFVFEEGYVRPHYITLEEGGVNGYSALRRDPQYYAAQPIPLHADKPHPAGPRFGRMAGAAMAYYLAASWLRPWFPHYRHHRDVSVWREGARWCLSGLRKLQYTGRDRRLTRRFAGDLSGRYFLVPLQVHSDSQIMVHSDYAGMEAFIRELASSFARHGPDGAWLVFKHHPMDRGARHYGKLMAALRAEYGLGERLAYAHEIHLPTALRHARGVVVINSTVGFSALDYGTPVKAMGRAIYDIAGLTCREPLDRFWQNPGTVSKGLFRAFRRHLVATTQINGCFHG